MPSTSAKIVRNVYAKSTCPWGIKALDILKRKGFQIEDVHLESTEASNAFKKEHDVDETPQIWIGEEHIGGYDDLREHLGLKPDPPEGDTYTPVIALFSVTLLMALTTCFAMKGEILPIRSAELFIAISMCVLGILKLQNLSGFATGFVQYDLIARRFVPYSYVYPFIEAGAGVAMIAGLFTWFVAPLALIASSIGAYSVFKAVYLEGRDLNCACVGGGSKVPLGFISLLENLMMMTMAIWMLVR